MAEVTIPEETEEETPTEEETIVVDKPTAQSKVISVNFNPLDTKVTTNIDTKEEFFTTDTDAWVVLNINEMSEPTGQYSLALINKDDGSVFQRTGDIVNGVAYYKLIQDEIKHAGRWTGQVVITLDNGRTTASRFNFTVAGHILDGKDVREIVIQDFQTLMAQLNSLKDIADVDLSTLLSSVEAAQTLAVENELERQETFTTNESARQVEYAASKTAFDENLTELSTLIKTDVVGLAVDEKYGEMEATYATNLTKLKTSDESIAAQLAQTFKTSDTGVLDLDVFNEESRTTLQGLEPGTINAVLGFGNVNSGNLAKDSVDNTKLDFGVLEIPKSKNGFDLTKVIKGYYVNYNNGNLVANASYSVHPPIAVEPNTPYSIKVLDQGVFKTKENVFISGFNTDSIQPIISPNNAYFIELSTPINALEKQQIEKGISSTDYELPNSLKKLPASRIETSEKLKIINTIIETLFNKSIKTKIKLIGDSITAGEGGTGFSPDGDIIPGSEAIFTGGRKISTKGYSWANRFKNLIDTKFNKTHIIMATDPMIKYDSPYSYNGAYDSSLIFTNKTKNRIGYVAFYGESITVRYTGAGNTGIIKIYIDGSLHSELDTYSATYGTKDFVISNLSDSSHKIEIFGTNSKNVSSSNFSIYLVGFILKKHASVVNYGISGYRSDTAMANATNLINSDDDIVLIQLGTNDRHNTANIEEVKKNIRKLMRVGFEKNPNIKFILMSANPTNPTEANQSAKYYSMFEVDKAIKELALEMNTEYISNYDAFLQYCEYTGKPLAELVPDTLHPGDLGYDVMFRNIVRHLGIPFVAPDVTK